jgi:hypothetical protein
MNLVEWSKSSVDYGRKLVHSAVDGALVGEKEFLTREPFYLGESARRALGPALFGACLGAVSVCAGNGRRSASRAIAGGLVGGVLGFGAALIWESRQLTARAASAAWKSITKTRDEHWFEKNPIDYA